MLNAVRQLEERNLPLDAEQERMRHKTCLVIAEFGAQLIETPLSDLQRMANLTCQKNNDKNLLCRIWDKHHFFPTAKMLRSMGGEDFPMLSPLITRLEEIWMSEVAPRH